MATDKQETHDHNAIADLNQHLTNAGERVANNKKIVWWGLGILAVVAAFVLSYLFIYRNPRLNDSWSAYNKVLLQVQKGEITEEASAKAYQNVADNFSGTPAGDCAALAAAESYYDQGKYDAAIKYLEKFSTAEPVMEAMSRVLLGDSYVNKGAQFYGKALEAYKTAVKKADGNPQIVPMTLIKEANVYDAQKNYAAALDCYEQIKEGYPQFQYGQMPISAYIAREQARLGK